MQRNHVAFLYQFFQRHVIIFFAGEFIVSENFHAEAFADIDEHSADFARAHYAHGFSVQIEPAQTVQAEIEIARTDIRLMRAAHGG